MIKEIVKFKANVKSALYGMIGLYAFSKTSDFSRVDFSKKLFQCINLPASGFPHLLVSPGKSWIFSLVFRGPGKS